LTLVVALACATALTMLATPAGAQSTKDRVAAARRAVDAAAQRWFDAQNKAASIDAHITQLEHDISSAEQRVAAAKFVASARALRMYENASLQFADITGENAIDLARSAQLMDHANAQNINAVNELTASIDNLHAQRKAVDAERAHQAKALKQVAAERDALDSQLASLEAKAAREDQAAAAAAAAAARTRQAVSRAAATAAPTAPVAHTVSADTAPPPPPPPAPPPNPPSNPPPPSRGVNPHHNDPFLVCTRARESNGDYSVVSADGQYYGAYQFLPSTWDVTANHAGRGDLVGVLPNRASEYDQDEIAWTLYQWQGKAPWGGRC
jgi:peptidoglycan hydrolase CwlO-like protein